MPEISTARLEPIRFRYLLDGAPVIGASLTVEISRFAEGGTLELLDWESGGFVAPDAVGAIFRLDFPELDAVAAPGVYYRLHDPAFPSNTVSPGVCTVTIYEGDEALFDGELRVGPIDAIDATAAAVADLQARTPASLVNGRMPVWVGAMGADVLTAAALAADAVQEISTLVASDLATAHGAGNWITATGFAVPGSAMALTPSERTTVQALILTDATPFPGARIDVSIGSRLASELHRSALGRHHRRRRLGHGRRRRHAGGKPRPAPQEPHQQARRDRGQPRHGCALRRRRRDRAEDLGPARRRRRRDHRHGGRARAAVGGDVAMAGFLGRARFLLGRAAVAFGLGARGGGPPAVVPKPGCMHLSIGDTASMEISTGDAASMEISIGDTASMTIEIEDC